MSAAEGSSRRGFLRVASLAVAGAVLAGCGVEDPQVRATGASAGPPSEEPTADAEVALARLLEGNRRYADDRPVALHEGAARRTEVAAAQHPFATVLTCVDSRVPPELVFDRGLGDLVVVRSAAGVLDRSVLGSVEFGVAELGTPLVLVLGHERCGAVTAAVESTGEPGGSMGFLVDAIRPAVAQARRQPGDVVDRAVRQQVRNVLAQLGRSPVLASAVRTKGVRLVGARYALGTGLVELT